MILVIRFGCVVVLVDGLELEVVVVDDCESAVEVVEVEVVGVDVGVGVGVEMGDVETEKNDALVVKKEQSPFSTRQVPGATMPSSVQSEVKFRDL